MNLDLLLDQTLAIRNAFLKTVDSAKDRASVIPSGWRNNLCWHTGHLIGTPRLLTLGLLGEDLGIPPEYRRWFAKGTSPADWDGDAIPAMDALMPQVTDGMRALFAKMKGREGERFPKPYTTSIGLVLTTPGEALQFSLAHDGIHLGLALALRRALG